MQSWNRIEIGGKAADVLPASSRRAVLFLHPRGNESPATDATFTDALRAADLACCCPFAPGTWWSERVFAPFDEALSAEQHLLQHVVPWMRSEWNLPERAIAVAGISMGGQGALRLGFQHGEQFPVVASIAGAIDYHTQFDNFEELPQLYRSRELCRQDTATLRVIANAAPRHIWFACDPLDLDWHPGNERLQEKLRAVGVAHTADLTTSAGGHSWDYFRAMAAPMMQFISTALAKESRRVVSLPAEARGCE